MSERVVENLNKALHSLFEIDPSVYLVGEDIADPYGGAFKVSKGLSTKYPKRVISTPISEQAIMGTVSGLALCGQKPIAEVMFGDFIMLGFDMIYNFAAKSVTMYGRRKDMPLVIRCPYGGNRGYGATHSQSPQKHFMGIPNLALFELSPLHDNLAAFQTMFELKQPCIFFENKVLYTKNMLTASAGTDNIFYNTTLENSLCHLLRIRGVDRYDVTIIAAGGQLYDALSAAKDLLLEHEIAAQILLATQLYPIDVSGWKDVLEKSKITFIVEEGIAGGSWGEGVFWRLGEEINRSFLCRVHLINSKEQVIPCCGHLEKEVLVQQEHIKESIRDIFYDSCKSPQI